jgi:SAM-dependent methyltransferase
VRDAVVSLAARHGSVRRVLGRAGRALADTADRAGALADARAAGLADMYEGSYFGEGRDPSGDRAGRSGYARYDRIASNADIAGWLLWRNFRVANSLDVGCATGYLVEVLRELGVEAEGCDLSPYAVEHAAPGAAGHLRVAGLHAGLPWPDHHFELVTVLETLEHFPPHRVPAALRELHRVCGGYLYATIPSFGRNASGPDGHYEGKVRPERLADYQAKGPGFRGPVPEEDLAVDADGRPVEGHLTIASFEWWTERFAEAGFARLPDVERRLYADIEPADLAPFWNLYVFEVAGAPPEMLEPRSPERSLRELGLRHPLLEVSRP